MNFPNATEQLPPSAERVVIRLLRRKGRNERYRLKCLLEGKRRDYMTADARQQYNRRYYLDHRVEILSKQKGARRHQKVGASRLSRFLQNPHNLCDIHGVSIVDAINHPVGAEIAAAFIEERTGIQVSPRTLYGWAARGRIPHTRLIGKLRFNLQELEAWLSASHQGLAGIAASQVGHEVSMQ